MRARAFGAARARHNRSRGPRHAFREDGAQGRQEQHEVRRGGRWRWRPGRGDGGFHDERFRNTQRGGQAKNSGIDGSEPVDEPTAVIFLLTFALAGYVCWIYSDQPAVGPAPETPAHVHAQPRGARAAPRDALPEGPAVVTGDIMADMASGATNVPFNSPRSIPTSTRTVHDVTNPEDTYGPAARGGRERLRRLRRGHAAARRARLRDRGAGGGGELRGWDGSSGGSARPGCTRQRSARQVRVLVRRIVGLRRWCGPAMGSSIDARTIPTRWAGCRWALITARAARPNSGSGAALGRPPAPAPAPEDASVWRYRERSGVGLRDAERARAARAALPGRGRTASPPPARRRRYPDSPRPFSSQRPRAHSTPGGVGRRAAASTARSTRPPPSASSVRSASSRRRAAPEERARVQPERDVAAPRRVARSSQYRRPSCSRRTRAQAPTKPSASLRKAAVFESNANAFTSTRSVARGRRDGN